MNEHQIPRYSMIIQWSPLDDAFVVTIPELSGAVTHGSTYEEAAMSGLAIMELVVEGLIQDGQPVPAPSTFKSAIPVVLDSLRDNGAVRRAS